MDLKETLVILGVVTHADAHVVVALNDFGRRLAHKTVPRRRPTTLRWSLGRRSFGVGLVRFLRARGVEVLEVNRPNCQHRSRRFGKHDTAAARTLQADTATGEPKSADGPAEMVRAPCTWHGVRRSRHVHRLLTNCTHCLSVLQKSSGHSCVISSAISTPNKTAGHSASRSVRTRVRGTLGGYRPSSRSAPSGVESGSATTECVPPPTGAAPAFRSTRSRAGRCAE